jgi:23S rRNA (cytosine1962-C5)-methyltransferase
MIQRIAVKIKPKIEQYVRKGHPWVYSESIIKTNLKSETGDLAIIFSHKTNKVIGMGLFDLDSPIRIKMIYSGSENPAINPDFFRDKITIARNKRSELLNTNTNSYRLVFGENDGFPGLIADVYNTTLVVKLYSNIWVHYIDSIINTLTEISQTRTVIIRLSRRMQKQNSYNFYDGQCIMGQQTLEEVEFTEHGVRFSANVIKGHKTGYFLDHRQNRRFVGLLSKGKTVLDVFAYAGGFSVHALAGGAKEVTSVDISEQALSVAKRNVELNIHSGKHSTLSGDAFEVMNTLIRDRKQFDIVIIDPPSFAKQQSEVSRAKLKYKELVQLGIRLTGKAGVLVMASCSSRIKAQTFFDLVKDELRSQSRGYDIIRTTEHDIDHPITFHEAAYLKTIYCSLD